jgi:hypothetical protein
VTGDDPFDVPDIDADDTEEASGGDGRDLHAARQAIAKLFVGDIAPFIERAEADPGFPFEPEAIGALSRIARADFERLRARLKSDSQVRLPALEAAIKQRRAEIPRATAVLAGRSRSTKSSHGRNPSMVPPC